MKRPVFIISPYGENETNIYYNLILTQIFRKKFIHWKIT